MSSSQVIQNMNYRYEVGALHIIVVALHVVFGSVEFFIIFGPVLTKSRCHTWKRLQFATPFCNCWYLIWVQKYLQS